MSEKWWPCAACNWSYNYCADKEVLKDFVTFQRGTVSMGTLCLSILPTPMSDVSKAQPRKRPCAFLHHDLATHETVKVCYRIDRGRIV